MQDDRAVAFVDALPYVLVSPDRELLRIDGVEPDVSMTRIECPVRRSPCVTNCSFFGMKLLEKRRVILCRFSGNAVPLGQPDAAFDPKIETAFLRGPQ